MSLTQNTLQNSRPLIQDGLLQPDGPWTLAIFIESGADACIMDEGSCTQPGLDGVPVSTAGDSHTPDHALLDFLLAWDIPGFGYTIPVSIG